MLRYLIRSLVEIKRLNREEPVSLQEINIMDSENSGFSLEQGRANGGSRHQNVLMNKIFNFS